ncbi:MAG: CBS domain-containing protein [Desulfobacterales bacterium]|nr:CBS domain-containing protein [Desulfobacterales bacterium]
MVSKTDIMGSFYAALPADTRISDIMVGPPYVCNEDDSLETAIDRMQRLVIHQLYVQSSTTMEITGQIAYSDIVGLLYRYCRQCVKSGRCAKRLTHKKIPRLIVAEVMTGDVASCHAVSPISEVIEILSEKRMGAVRIKNEMSAHIGIVSKTDLILGYIRGITLDESALSIMNSPVTCCRSGDKLSHAIQQMLLFDIQRIFVTNNNGSVEGVLSLSDATRFRSGTCRACAAGQILAD